MNSNIRLYSIQDIDELLMPEDPSARCAYRYAVPMIKNGVEQYINNVDTDLRLLVCGNLFLPVTINSVEWDNSYVCSPYTHYISYAKEELGQIPIKSLQVLFRWILNCAGSFLKKRDFNRVVIINNWMLSTNLYPTISARELQIITEYLQKQFPDHAIMFRSINDMQHQMILDEFRKLDYLLIASRQVYICDARHPENLSARARKHINADKQKLDKHKNVISLSEFSKNIAERIAKLYRMLYLDKYSYSNPEFNTRYMQHVSEVGAINFTGLEQDNVLVGIAGTFYLNCTLSAPIHGYDTSLSQKEALYRRLSSLTYHEAKNISAIFNNSSGVSEFKLNRGFMAVMEYSAVYISHLPRKQQHGWRMIRSLVNMVGIPAMKFFKL
jgi:hypothetical protein